MSSDPFHDALVEMRRLAKEHMHERSDKPLAIYRSSKQWWRLVEGTPESPDSILAFIAAEDGQNKKLGAWKQGDIFAPQTWESPAKHVRGNIFRPGYERNFSKWGIKYLKECVTA